MQNELLNLVDYVGQERAARKLAVREGIIPVEKAAVMTDGEIYEKILEKYEVFGKFGTDIYLVKKEDAEKARSMFKILSR